MGNLMKAEWFKLRKDRSFWTLMLALSGAALLYTALVFIDEQGAVQHISVSLLYADALGGNGYIIRLVPVILAGFFISSEYSAGTMKSIVASGNSRIRIYGAKLITFMLGAAILSLVFPLILTAAGGIASGFYDMPDLGYVARTLALHMLYAASFASIMSMFAILFTDSGKTIGFLLLLFLLIDSILFMISQKAAWFEPIFLYSVFNLFSEVGKGNIASDQWFSILVVPVLTCIGMWLLGSYIFTRKEIK